MGGNLNFQMKRIKKAVPKIFVFTLTLVFLFTQTLQPALANGYTESFENNSQINAGSSTNYWATTNGTATGTTVVAGQYSNARNFNGTSDWVDLGTNKVGPLINGASQVTVSLWIKPSAFPAVSARSRIFSVNMDDVANPPGILVR